MIDTTLNLEQAIFAKSEIGLREIKTRELRLSPMVRRLLILVDGKRSGRELAPLVVGQTLDELMAELIDKECVTLISSTNPVPAAKPATALAAPDAVGAAADPALAQLPPADSRSAKELDMARNFMTNTLNMEFGMNMRMSLIESIANCNNTAALRQVYPTWRSTMASSKGSAKELPTLIDKLFRVL